LAVTVKKIFKSSTEKLGRVSLVFINRNHTTDFQSKVVKPTYQGYRVFLCADDSVIYRIHCL